LKFKPILTNYQKDDLDAELFFDFKCYEPQKQNLKSKITFHPDFGIPSLVHFLGRMDLGGFFVQYNAEWRRGGII